MVRYDFERMNKEISLMETPNIINKKLNVRRYFNELSSIQKSLRWKKTYFVQM